MSEYRLAAYRGKWCITWHDGRGTQRRSLGVVASKDNRAAAEAAVAEFEVTQRRQAARRGLTTVQSILDAYYQERPHVMQRKAIAVFFGKMTPYALDMAACKKYAAGREKLGIRPATINTELGVLRSALTWARANQWIEIVPVLWMPKRGQPRERWLSEQEARRLLAAAGGRHIRLFIEIALHTGGRKGAILGLTWDRVDLEGGRIDFRDPGTAPSRKRRSIVPVSQRLLAALKSAYEARTSDYVIEWVGQPVKSIKRGFARACARAQLEGVSPHTLRHTAATWAAQGGAPMWEIAGLLGHTSTSTTERVYAKHHPEYLRQAVGAIEDRLSQTQHSTQFPLGSIEPVYGNKGGKKRGNRPGKP